MIYKEFIKGQQVYLLNSLLKSYLLEEKRIPGGEYNRLLQRNRTFKLFDKEIPEEQAFNFGLKTIINKNEIMSFNMSIDLLENIEGSEDHMEVINKLYPGNYLLPLYKSLIHIRRDRTGFSIYNEINTEFVHASNFVNYDELKVMLNVWKSLLYMVIGKYDDVIHDIDYINSYSNEHQSLLSMLKGAALSKKATEEYASQRYTRHDDFRYEANELFLSSISDFMSRPYFFFVKRNILSCYHSNSRHLKNQNPEYKDFSFVTDFNLIRTLYF
ncbi:hypothetical protein PAECIP111893_01083 [Paenibacillus plantiphilus]|uniref:Uncharacterized protein n=1 Tax=Paenibacillus plantiphilus TaxID=2905650 RepID=A0ABM9BZC2_9BACL|nr:hypothetical protein PAECIP111893_01083 [Paenibacillus plantiphilus]